MLITCIYLSGFTNLCIPWLCSFPPIVGIPGVKTSLLEEYGVRLVTYDLPGFGESDPHPNRNLNSSAMDMLHLVNAVNVSDKFWLLCHSSGCIYAWASLKYIPERIAGCSPLWFLDTFHVLIKKSSRSLYAYLCLLPLLIFLLWNP